MQPEGEATVGPFLRISSLMAVCRGLVQRGGRFVYAGSSSLGIPNAPLGRLWLFQHFVCRPSYKMASGA